MPRVVVQLLPGRTTAMTQIPSGRPIMNKLLPIALLLLSCHGVAMSQGTPSRYVRLAELEIDPAQMEAFVTATREVGQASVQSEDGCIALYAVVEKDNPTRVRVFEIYRDAAAYEAHVQTAHFRKFRTTTEAMVRARKLIDANPVSLATKPGVVP